MMLLTLAAAVLVAHPPLRRAADRATCCRSSGCETSETAPISKGPLFRIPSRCSLVIGNGTKAAGSPFDPCDFDAPPGALGGLYLPACATHPLPATLASVLNLTTLEEAPTQERPCERSLRPTREVCIDAGPWHFGTLSGGISLSCAQLNDDGACDAELRETRLFRTHAHRGLSSDDAAPAGGRVAEWCPLTCMPWLCLNSEVRQQQVKSLQSITPLNFDQTESQKPEGEAATIAEAKRNASKASARAIRIRRERLGTWRALPPEPEELLEQGDAETHAALRESACRKRLTTAFAGEARRSHGVPHMEFGRLWCPKIETSTALAVPEVVGSACQQIPWWENNALTDATLTRRQQVLAVVLQLAFGIHGVFSYLAASLASAAVGLHLHYHGPTRSLFGVGACGCILAFAIGLYCTYQLRSSVEEEDLFVSQPAVDAFLRAASHSRLLWGAADMAIILIGIAFVDAVPARRAAWERSTPRFRRLGQRSLTMFAWNDVFGRLVYIPFRNYAASASLSLLGTTPETIGAEWMFGSTTPTGTNTMARVRQHFADDACLVLYLIAMPLCWMALLAVWSQCRYIGSFEWWIGLFIGVGKATRAPAATASQERDGSTSGSGGDAAAVWIWLLTMTWTPAATWSVLSALWLAPSMDDYYYQLNASHFLLTPRGVHGASDQAAADGHWQWLVHANSPPMKLSISAHLFLLTYVLPVAACSLHLLFLHLTGRRKQAKRKPE